MNAITRRSFLQSTAAGAVVLSQLPSALGAAGSEPKIKLGLIGCGWYGMVDLKAAVQTGGFEVVALCDVDSSHLTANADEVEKLCGKRPQTFKLYQEFLKTPGLEAVIIATPPHWHALQFLAALERGVDIYCEKPLSYDVREGRAMVDAAQKAGRIVQVGFQRRQSPAFQAVRRRIESGQTGPIVCAEATINYTAGTKDPTPQDPPAVLDWDLWCGPAPKLPYSPQVGHMNWRLEKEFGHGHLVDWGIHLVDAARVILGEKMPKSVSAAGGLYGLKNKITTPDVLTAHFDFASCPLTWRHRIWGAEEYSPEVSNGIFFYGEKETLFVTDDRWVVIPRGKGKDRQVQEVKADTGGLHMAEFLNAVRTRKQPGCQPQDAYLSTATVKLAMIAYETGTRIEWDPQQEQIVGNPAAAKLLRREYRKPWMHPYPA
ncbi:MAG TPA: Gfo/Idh/MocA family oxidoreductase [Verrucomicrobiae bacterium]|nr:Gfo/Idh/MocA family oxidoreductase [Verrucomicrobiae bacterium]